MSAVQELSLNRALDKGEKTSSVSRLRRRSMTSSLICILWIVVAPLVIPWPNLAGPRNLAAQGPLDKPGFLTDGRTEVMRVVWREQKWDVTTSDGEQVGPAVVQWGRLAERLKPTLILAHGEVVSDFLGLDAKQLTIGRDPYKFSQRPLWAEQTLLREKVRGFVLQWPAEQSARDRLRNAVRNTAGRKTAPMDRVWFVDGEFLDGRVVETQGVEARIEELKVLRGGREVLIPLRRISAIRFAPRENSDDRDSDDGELPIRWQLGFQDGTFLAVAALTEPAGTVEVVMPDSLRLRLPADAFRRSVCFFRPVRKDVTWLGDKEPLDVLHVPFFTGAWPLGRNTNLWGGRLREIGQWHDRGLAMHSTTRVAYDLDGTDSILQARLALDVSAGQGGSVRYRVFSRPESDSPWKEIYASRVVRGSDEPIDISVPVVGARQLALIVEFAEGGDVLDRACWFGARLVTSGKVAGTLRVP